MVAPKVPLYLRKRYYVMMALFVGQFIEILVKINLSICIVEITSKKAVTVGNTTIYQVLELLLNSLHSESTDQTLESAETQFFLP